MKKKNFLNFLVLNLAIFMRRRKSLFWARRGVCDEFFYSCRQTNGKALSIARKYHAMCAIINRGSHDGKKRICHLLTIMTVFQVLLFLNIHLPSVAYISTSNPWVINSRPSGLLYFHFFGSFISVKHVTVNSITWRESSKDSSNAFRMASSSSSY